MTLIVLGAIGYTTYLILQPFLTIIITAFIVAVFLAPLYNQLHLRGMPPVVAGLISVTVFLIGILVPVVFVSVSIFREATEAVIALQRQPDLLNHSVEEVAAQLRGFGIVDPALTQNILQEIVGVLRTISTRLGTIFLQTGTFLVSTVFIVMTAFFILIHKTAIRRFLQTSALIPEQYYLMIERRVVQVLNGIVRGNIVIFLLQCLVSSLGFWVFGVSPSLLLGVLYGIFSFVPNIGVVLIWLPLAIALYLQAGPLPALLFASWFVLSNMFLDSFISPKIIGIQTHLHQILVMFSVLGGLSLFGPLGLVIGPTVIAVAFVALDIYKDLIASDIVTE